MTDNAAPSTSERPTDRFERRRSPLNLVVAGRAQVLQRLSLQDVPSAVRTLAVLRRAVGSSPGSAPDAWQETIGRLPVELLGRDDEPSAAEYAIHHAMTLFALHRQGRVEKAHVDGVAPGAAFAQIALRRGGGKENEGVRRRFDALVTASTQAEAAHYLRGLILLARSEDVGLDYGYLCDDLVDLWTPRRRDHMRLRWARQYRGMRGATADDEPESASASSAEPTPQEQ